MDSSASISSLFFLYKNRSSFCCFVWFCCVAVPYTRYSIDVSRIPAIFNAMSAFGMLFRSFPL